MVFPDLVYIIALLLGLGFVGIDIVIDRDKGPQVLEVNTRPGLNIQLANQSSLRTRLERIENITVPSISRGVELGKSLFGDDHTDEEGHGQLVLSVVENVTLTKGNQSKTVKAKLDTGAFRTALDSKLVEEMGYKLLDQKILIKSASGSGYRHSVKISFRLYDRLITTVATVVDRKHLKYPLIIGRRDLNGVLVNPELPEDAEDYPEEYLVSQN